MLTLNAARASAKAVYFCCALGHLFEYVCDDRVPTPLVAQYTIYAAIVEPVLVECKNQANIARAIASAKTHSRALPFSPMCLNSSAS